MSSLGERLKHARLNKGITQKQLAEYSDKSQQAIFNIECGNSLRPRNMQKIAKILNVDLIWLLHGENRHLDSFKEIPIKNISKVDMELIDWTILKSIWTGDNNMQLSKSLDLSFLGNKNCKAISVVGNAMVSENSHEISFHEKDIIIINMDKKAANGDFVAAIIPKLPEGILRKYVIDGGVCYLVPLNRSYPIIKVKKDVKICGVVCNRLSFFD